MTRPLLSVIVPVYNEARTIDDLLARVLDAPLAKQVIVVDDGSTDSTADKLQKWKRKVISLRHSENRGKGAAIRTALAHAHADLTIVQDADLEYDPRDYVKLLAPMLAGHADAVYGSRYKGSRQPWSVCRAGVSLLNQTLRALYAVRLTDEATCYKIFRTQDLRQMHLESDGFEFCPEVTAKACRMGLRIQEIPISYTARTVAAGKKIRWRDGLGALLTLWRFRSWQPSNR